MVVAIKIEYLPAYTKSKVSLNDEQRLSVDLAEQLIIADPTREYMREVGPNGVRYDYNTPGLIIGYQEPRPHEFVFVEVEVLA